MDILMMNGSPIEGGMDARIGEVRAILAGKGHSVRELKLRDMKYSPCRGCFSCWVKNPGRCVFKDDGDILCRETIQSDMVILASPMIMGYPSALSKNALDRIIPLLHPYLEEVDGEAHHMKRYERYPSLGLLLEKEQDTDDEDLEIVHDLFLRASINLRSSLKFIAYTDDNPEEALHAIDNN